MTISILFIKLIDILSRLFFITLMYIEAFRRQVKGGGGTDTFRGLSAAVGIKNAQPGSRAVLAIFDVIDSIAPAVQNAGLELKVNIIGFDIKEAEAREQLEAIAASTGGAYLDAKDSEQLLSSLEQTLKVEFVLLDGQGKIIAKGTVGGKPVEILEGTYTLRLLLAPEPIEMEVSVRPDQTLKLLLKKDNQTWKIQEK